MTKRTRRPLYSKYSLPEGRIRIEAWIHIHHQVVDIITNIYVPVLDVIHFRSDIIVSNGFGARLIYIMGLVALAGFDYYFIKVMYFSLIPDRFNESSYALSSSL